MYYWTPADSFFHLPDKDFAASFTLCGKLLNPPEKRRRFEDYNLIEQPPTDRLCALCSRCAELSGDNRSLKERFIYPKR